MRRPRRGWIAALAVVPLTLLAGFGSLLAGPEGRSVATPMVAPPAAAAVTMLGDAETAALGWDPRGLETVFDYADSLGSDTLMIVTEGRTVASFGDLTKPWPLHSIRKALLSALVGQHQGLGEKRIDLTATLAKLQIDDSPGPLTPLQKQATVLHLLKSLSGINHPAAAEEGLLEEKNRRLGQGENTPGTVWAYNNWDYNALTTVFETRTGMPVARAFDAGIANPLDLRDFTPEAVTYRTAPALSQHRAAMFRMSARDLARFGGLYLNRGEADGERVLPAAWIDRITSDFTETGIGGLRWGHGYLWWLPAPESGLPTGTFWARGLGGQALFVIPAWRSVVVHQADTAAFLSNVLDAMNREALAPGAALEKVALLCLDARERSSAFCRDHRLILRREFEELVARIAAARR